MDRLISEQAVIDAISKWLYDKTRKESIETVIKAIPSAEPKCESCELNRQRFMQTLDVAFELGKASAEPKVEQWKDFVLWVAKEIFDEWEYNKDAFAEIACRKLAKLGIVRAKGDEWELVEPQESDHTCHTCKHYTSGERDGSCGSYICKGYSNWESEDKE